jgi:hypothetical protein
MAHDPLGCNFRHELIPMVDALATAVAQGECDGVS